MIACDSHVHVFGPRDRYPQIDRRAYTAGIASAETLKANGAPLGISRFVIVQASVNGTDNSCLLDSLDALDGHGRGVVVIDPRAITSQELDAMHQRGVRGLRINLYSGFAGPERAGPRRGVGGGPERPTLQGRFEALADIAPDGWHIEVIAPIRMLAEAAPLLASSRVPVVLDHYGLPGSDTPDSANGRALLDLLCLPHVWMKLSGPYRALEGAASDPVSTMPPAEWLRAFVETARDRLVWGSDWPHTPPHEDCRCGDAPDPFRAIDYGQMFGDFLMAISEPRTLEAILAANPARLYGFA
jgi:predicted TIM-barrel fold metal-dependent hydrolase